jgi:hypothetical protein
MKQDENAECLEFRRKIMVHGAAAGQEYPHCSECHNCAAFMKALGLTESATPSVSAPSAELDSAILDHAAQMVRAHRCGPVPLLSWRSARVMAAAAGLVFLAAGVWLVLNQRSGERIGLEKEQEKMVIQLAEESSLLDDEIAEVAIAMAAMESELWGGTEAVSTLGNGGWDSLDRTFDALDAELYMETVEQTDDAG